MTLSVPAGVLNTYAGIELLKSMIGVTSESHDDALWRHLHAASRAVDAWCRRRFYVEHATRTFDVAEPVGFGVPDMVAVESIVEDADGDRVYEVTRESDDYLLRPLDADPSSAGGRPYMRIIADPQGARPSFSTGYSRVQVTGSWGYRDHREPTGASLDIGGPLATGTTSFAASDGSLVRAGSTVLVEDEQMFVREVSGSTITVERGVNGTSAVTHADGIDVLWQAHPPAVVESALLLAARGWKRKDSAYGPVAGVNSLGGVRVVPGHDPDVEAFLAPFRRLHVAASKVLC